MTRPTFWRAYWLMTKALLQGVGIGLLFGVLGFGVATLIPDHPWLAGLAFFAIAAIAIGAGAWQTSR